MQARNAFDDSIVSSFDWEYLKNIQLLHFNIRIRSAGRREAG